MSDLQAAAAAMGVPESLVQRSAEARAKATGSTTEQVLAAWAGGAPPPTTVQTEAPTVERQTPQAPVTVTTPMADAERPKTPAVASAVVPAASSQMPSGAPPILVAARQGTSLLTSGTIGLLILSLLLAIFIPSLPVAGDGVRTSRIAFSQQGLAGRTMYSEQGCGSCHTQLVRNVVTDFGLGPATLPDSNQVVGYRRVGPDLAAIGTRIEDTAALTAMLTGDRGHPSATGLSADDIGVLLAYLRESR
ncbi:MAG: hypothetical protein ACT4OP_07655 [Actinomycetota bacterium]